MDIANNSRCYLSPIRLSDRSPIPWPSSGRKKHRQISKKGPIKPSKLSTKYVTSNNANVHSPCKNTSANKSLLSGCNRRKSIGEIFNKYYREVSSAGLADNNDFSDDDNEHRQGLLSANPNNFVWAPKPTKSLVNGQRRSPDQDTIVITESDSSPEPLFKRIAAKTPVLEGNKELTKDDMKTPSNKIQRPHGWRSCTAKRSTLRDEITLSTSDDEDDILPLHKRITQKPLISTDSDSSLPDIRPSTSKTKKPTFKTPTLVTSDTDSDDMSKLKIQRRPKSVTKKPVQPLLLSDLTDSSSSSSLDKWRSKSVTKKTKRPDDNPSSKTSPNKWRSTVVPPSILKSLMGPSPPRPLQLKDSTKVHKSPPRTKPKSLKSSEPKPVKTPVSNFKLKNGAEVPKSPTSRARDFDAKNANKIIKSFIGHKSIARSELHQETLKYIDNYAKYKPDLAQFLYSLYNKHVFDNELPPKMVLTWKPRLTNTAGLCMFRRKVGPGHSDAFRESRIATIDLSVKVLDSPDRLCNTLIHEMCHAATWIINGIKDSHHGRVWKNWGDLASQRLPSLPPMKRTHNYEIKTKYVYMCTKCGKSFGRHSKSLDITKKVCGANRGTCRGTFQLMQDGKVIATVEKQGTAFVQVNAKNSLTPFAKFVKENYGKVKQSEATKHGDVMKKLGQLFADKAKLS